MSGRLTGHPILGDAPAAEVPFTFAGRPLLARRGETIASALYANGIRIFGHHPRDGGAQGIFCANGQCSQCLVLADGRPVKACMVPVQPGMSVQPCEGQASLPEEVEAGVPHLPEELETDVLVVGGGPAGLTAAAELGRAGLSVLLVDDKDRLGGKLTLQTHAFFGSVRACHAGTRGIRIAEILAGELPESVQVWLETTAVGVFSDGKVGLVRRRRYVLVRPKVLLLAAGARERTLLFPGADLPGVYGAGAFQTLVNRDLVAAAERLFVVGGGNVGLIAAYHALQAGIDVVGLVEALPQVGGYKVHRDKILRLGVPVWTSHTVVRAEGREHVEQVVVARCGRDFQPIAGTERAFGVDTVLVAVGLVPVSELADQAREAGLPVVLAGDAGEIAEASAAIFSGRMAGRQVAGQLGRPAEIPASWRATAEVLKSRPGRVFDFEPEDLDREVFPVLACNQEIPCNPCTQVCPLASIAIPDGSLTSPPVFQGDCIGCGRCVLVCPGLAIRLVLKTQDPDRRLLVLPWEMPEGFVQPGSEVATVDMEGRAVGRGRVVGLQERPDFDRRRLLLLDVPASEALQVAGFRIREPEEGQWLEEPVEDPEDPIVCRCERVRRSEILEAIRAGIRDYNVLKAVTRASMGACGGKTCRLLVMRLFAEEGVDPKEVVPPTVRPPVTEVELGVLAGLEEE